MPPFLAGTVWVVKFRCVTASSGELRYGRHGMLRIGSVRRVQLWHVAVRSGVAGMARMGSMGKVRSVSVFYGRQGKLRFSKVCWSGLCQGVAGLAR